MRKQRLTLPTSRHNIKINNDRYLHEKIISNQNYLFYNQCKNNRISEYLIKYKYTKVMNTIINISCFFYPLDL